MSGPTPAGLHWVNITACLRSSAPAFPNTAGRMDTEFRNDPNCRGETAGGLRALPRTAG